MTIPPQLDFIKSLWQQAIVEQSRSTVLQPLGWLLFLVITAIAGTFYVGVPTWITITFAIFCFIIILIYVFVYGYLFFTDRDSLRTEKFLIQREMIEKGYIGDSTHGLLARQDVSSPLSLSSGKAKNGEEEKKQ